MKSINHWKNCYQNGGTSGAGSAALLKEFKVNFINSFIEKNKIKSILDFGHGDLQIAKELKIKNYTGIDIFTPKENYGLNLINVKFDEYDGDSAELVICLDVLYHILKEEQNYLKKSIDKMLEKSNKYIMIYAQDSRKSKFDSMYAHLYNSQWVQYIESLHDKPKIIYEQEHPEKGTSAKFFIYEK